MADTYEKDLSQKSSLTTSDYVRVVGSDNVSYKQLVSAVAKTIVESYSGSSLAGSSRSIQSALNAITYKAGDTISNLTIHTAAYLTSGSTMINITLPLNRVITASSFSVTSLEAVTRQNGQYTHGSSSSGYVTWTATSVGVTAGGIYITMERTSDTTNAINNAPIGLALRLSGTFA